MLKKIVSMSDIQGVKHLSGDGPSNCLSGSCPSIFETEDGNYIFQGFILNDEQKRQLTIASNEDAISIPKELLEALRR